jgi:hypothetical protein
MALKVPNPGKKKDRPPTCLAVMTLKGVIAVPDPPPPTMPTNWKSGAATSGKIAKAEGVTIATAARKVNLFFIIPLPRDAFRTRKPHFIADSERLSR